MQVSEIRRTATLREAATRAVLGPSVALTEARTEGVKLFERSPPLHSVLPGGCRVAVNGTTIQRHHSGRSNTIGRRSKGSAGLSGGSLATS